MGGCLQLRLAEVAHADSDALCCDRGALCVGEKVQHTRSSACIHTHTFRHEQNREKSRVGRTKPVHPADHPQFLFLFFLRPKAISAVNRVAKFLFMRESFTKISTCSQFRS